MNPEYLTGEIVKGKLQSHPCRVIGTSFDAQSTVETDTGRSNDRHARPIEIDSSDLRNDDLIMSEKTFMPYIH